MALLLLIAVFVLLGFAPAAEGFQLGIQDQGADTETLTGVAGMLGAQSIRIIARPGEPHVAQVKAYHQAGYRVQAAIQLKRWSTPNDVRSLMRSWGGMVQTVSIGNEPELNGLRPCTYGRLYREAYGLIRREFPGTRIGFGEFSPTDPLGYTKRVIGCGYRLRADFWAVHPYQFHSDPLGPPVTERAMGAGIPSWMGLGSLGAAHRFLHANRKQISTRTGNTLPIRATEFAYLTSGGYATSQERAAWMWPRAIRQAKRWTEQFIVYGLGAVHEGSGWGSASLIDRFGRRLPSLIALATGLGRLLPAERVVDPPREVVTDLPDLSSVRVPFIPAGEAAFNDSPPAIEAPVTDAPFEAPSAPAEPVEVPVEPTVPVTEEPGHE